MPKIKTSRAAAKRFKKTGTGKLKRNKAYKSHILTKKSTKRKRNLRHATIADADKRKEYEENLTIFIRFSADRLKEENKTWQELKADLTLKRNTIEL